MAAQPEIDERATQLISKGRWGVPGYKVSFKLFCSIGAFTNVNFRKNSVTCLYCKFVSSLLRAIDFVPLKTSVHHQTMHESNRSKIAKEQS